MPPKPSQTQIAGLPRRAAARSHDAGQRRHPSDKLHLLSADVDELLRLESLETRSAAEHDYKVALAEKIAAAAFALRQRYRGPSTAPCRAPIATSADGLKAMW